ncbi:hypothetical protein ACQEVZ_01950 [Dactylosporangium sp. CA-152071]|uniref:hypothetical protein n=1 Tax=Dactylosporangium sp. CA-152071 TaxID=3239933 RepID=UPI003D935AF3
MGVWSLGARSFNALVLQNLAHAKRVDPQESISIQNTGTNINVSARQFSQPVGGQTNPLFVGLVNEYTTRMQTVSDELGNLRKEVTAEQYDFCSPANQYNTVPRLSSPGSISRCSDGPAFPRPPNAGGAHDAQHQVRRHDQLVVDDVA